MSERSDEKWFYGPLELITDCVEDNIGVGDYYFGEGCHFEEYLQYLSIISRE